MKKKNIPVEFVFQSFALIITIIVIHAFYVTVVRPNAARIIEEQAEALAADPAYVKERRVSILIKDM
ncbi:MAG: MotA/TolQ/ExbB proton channel family protein, partial [Proteobacteria bacterium]|nr:MotA/TolQ/ExbB proton channel family protein [Pseudomonadota bacterium]